MIAAEHHERVRFERLHADRDPADPGRAPRREVGIAAIGRVRLDPDLARRTAKPPADPLDRGCDAVGPPQRRSSATEINGDELAGERAGTELELAQDRVEVGLMRW